MTGDSRSRYDALREEMSALIMRIADLTEQAEDEALAGRMDRWAITRQRIRPLAARLAEVHENMAALHLTDHPKRTQSEWVTR